MEPNSDPPGRADQGRVLEHKARKKQGNISRNHQDYNSVRISPCQLYLSPPNVRELEIIILIVGKGQTSG